MKHKELDQQFKKFIEESLSIEDIWRGPTDEEMKISWDFLKKDSISILDLVEYVKVFQPDAVLRDNPSKRVWIGGREAPLGGEELLRELNNLLKYYLEDPWSAHAEYERLHPFTDGNGRSGRILWAWIMNRKGYKFEYKFLQMYYYQTLQQYTKEYL